MEHTRVVIDPSFSNEPVPEDENPVHKIKDEKYEEKDALNVVNSS